MSYNNAIICDVVIDAVSVAASFTGNWLSILLIGTKNLDQLP